MIQYNYAAVHRSYFWPMVILVVVAVAVFFGIIARVGNGKDL